jgi:hypothetical protein
MRRLILCICLALACWLALLPRACYGQAQSQPAASQTAPTQSPSASAQPPAKVWTNDDMDELHESGGISIVGKDGGAKRSGGSSKPNSYEKDPAWYRKRLDPLRADIEKLDPQIAKTKAFLSGENVSDPRHYYHGPPGNPRDQLARMEKKRQEDAAKIDDLLDRARHNGIEPGALR